MSEQKTQINLVSIPGLLGVAFIVLRLTEVIKWDWWWVLAPFWIPVALYIIFLIMLLLFIAILGKNLK
jgi:hypothetical protein